jgi:hypothetical protein
MEEVTLKIPDKKYQFFMELIRSIGFVKIEKTDDEADLREAIIDNLKDGFKEMKQFRDGKKKGTPLKDFLNEL